MREISEITVIIAVIIADIIAVILPYFIIAICDVYNASLIKKMRRYVQPCYD